MERVPNKSFENSIKNQNIRKFKQNIRKCAVTSSYLNRKSLKGQNNKNFVLIDKPFALSRMQIGKTPSLSEGVMHDEFGWNVVIHESKCKK